MRRTLLFIVVLASGCSKGASNGVDCGSGGGFLEESGARYCTYASVSASFACPAKVPYRLDVEGHVVCGDADRTLAELPTSICTRLGTTGCFGGTFDAGPLCLPAGAMGCGPLPGQAHCCARLVCDRHTATAMCVTPTLADGEVVELPDASAPDDASLSGDASESLDGASSADR